MSDNKPFSFDFSGDGDPRSRAELAASEITREKLIGLFAALEIAGGLWGEPTQGPRRAAREALAAVNNFIGGAGYDLAGEFSRPLRVLAEELRNAPAAAPGNILPPVVRRQSIEASQRSTINRLKALAAFAAIKLGELDEGRKAAANRVAAVLVEHEFPRNDYWDASGKRKGDDKRPTVATIAERVGEWCKRLPEANNEPGREFRALETSPPVLVLDRTDIEQLRYIYMQHLTNSLIASGFTETRASS